MTKIQNFKMFIDGEWLESLSNDLINSSFTEINDGKHLCSIECADDVNIKLRNFIGN